MTIEAARFIALIWLHSLCGALCGNFTILDTSTNSLDELSSTWSYHPQSSSWTILTMSDTSGVPVPIFSTACGAKMASSSWLRSPFIAYDGVNRYHVTVQFSIRDCTSIPSLSQCKQFFNIYFVEASSAAAAVGVLPPNVSSLQSVYPSATVYADYYTSQPNQVFLTNVVNSDVPVSSAGNGFYLYFQAPTACIALTSIKVYYTVCDAIQLNLFSLPRTYTGQTIVYPFPVASPVCTANSVWNSSIVAQNSYSFMCVNTGTWVSTVTQTVLNLTYANQFPLLCSCIAGYQPDSSTTTCIPCGAGTFKNWIGNNPCVQCPVNAQTNNLASTSCSCSSGYYRAPLETAFTACTSPPNVPTQLRYTTNSGYATVQVIWSSPTNLGGRSDLFYTISYNSSQGLPNQGLYSNGSFNIPSAQSLGVPYAFATTYTSITIYGLQSSTKYVITVQSWNGVSQQALQSASLPANTASITVTTPSPSSCILSDVSFFPLNSTLARVTWSFVVANYPAYCQSTMSAIELFELQLWTTARSGRRKRDVASSLVAIQYVAPVAMSLNAQLQLPNTSAQYAVQVRALTANKWTSVQQTPVALQLAPITPPTATITLPVEAVQADQSVVALIVGIVVAVFVVAAAIAAFFIIRRRRYRQKKSDEFQKFRRTSKDQMTASSASSSSADSQRAAVVDAPPPNPFPAANFDSESRINNSAAPVQYNTINRPLRTNTLPHSVRGMAANSNDTTLSTLSPGISQQQCPVLHPLHAPTQAAPLAFTLLASNNDANTPDDVSIGCHESCSCASLSYLGTYTNSAFRVYVDPRTYEDPNILVRAFATELHAQSIVLESVIGSGEFGDVCLGKLDVAMNVGRIKQLGGGNELDSGQLTVAVKTLKQEHRSEKSRRDFLLEASILGQFEHPNILRLVGVVTRSRPVMIVTEFMKNGSLDGFLRERRDTNPLSLRQRTAMLLDVANGMKYLAERCVIHRDLAARNILIDEQLVCKVSDFGLSRKLHSSACKGASQVATVDETAYQARGGKIPVRWTAPEAIQYRTFSQASDVWSFGVLAWETMLYGERPFWNWSNQDAMASVTNGFRLPRLDDTSPAVYALMLQCWEMQPHDRPPFANIFDQLYDLVSRMDKCDSEVLASVDAERSCACRLSWWTMQTLVSHHERESARAGRPANELMLTEAELQQLNHLSRQMCVDHWLYTINLHHYASQLHEVAHIDTMEQLCAALAGSDDASCLGFQLPAEYELLLCSAAHQWHEANSDGASTVRSVHTTSACASTDCSTLRSASRHVPPQSQPQLPQQSSVFLAPPDAGSFV